MKIVTTKHSKDGLATVTLELSVDWAPEQIDTKKAADQMLDLAGAVLNTRYKEMKRKEKEKNKKQAGRL